MGTLLTTQSRLHLHILQRPNTPWRLRGLELLKQTHTSNCSIFKISSLGTHCPSAVKFGLGAGDRKGGQLMCMVAKYSNSSTGVNCKGSSWKLPSGWAFVSSVFFCDHLHSPLSPGFLPVLPHPEWYFLPEVLVASPTIFFLSLLGKIK